MTTDAPKAQRPLTKDSAEGAMTTDHPEPRTKNKEEKTFRFLFFNQFLPPDPAPTARLIGDVVAELRRRGHEIVLIGDSASYHGRKTLAGSRVLRELFSLLRLLMRGLFTRRVDVIVCLTSPPLVPVVAWLVRIRHGRAKLIHWAMDLYPDVAVALGEVREGSLLHRITSALMGRVYRSCDLIVALDEDMGDRIGLHGARCEAQPPWPPPFTFQPPMVNGQLTTANRPFTWLYSGNLGRAHEWKTLLDAQHRLELEGIEATLVFQGGSAEREAATRYAKSLGLTRCHWQPYADDAELIPSLLEADSIVATQRPETKGCLWPSKLALALLLERPIVWVGPADSRVTTLLRARGHSCFAPNESVALAEAIKILVTQRELSSRRETLEVIGERIEKARREGMEGLVEKIESTVRC